MSNKKRRYRSIQRLIEDYLDTSEIAARPVQRHELWYDFVTSHESGITQYDRNVYLALERPHSYFVAAVAFEESRRSQPSSHVWHKLDYSCIETATAGTYRQVKPGDNDIVYYISPINIVGMMGIHSLAPVLTAAILFDGQKFIPAAGNRERGTAVFEFISSRRSSSRSFAIDPKMFTLADRDYLNETVQKYLESLTE